jgi:hypothetical protein
MVILKLKVWVKVDGGTLFTTNNFPIFKRRLCCRSDYIRLFARGITLAGYAG